MMIYVLVATDSDGKSDVFGVFSSTLYDLKTHTATKELTSVVRHEFGVKAELTDLEDVRDSGIEWQAKVDCYRLTMMEFFVDQMLKESE